MIDTDEHWRRAYFFEFKDEGGSDDERYFRCPICKESMDNEDSKYLQPYPGLGGISDKHGGFLICPKEDCRTMLFLTLPNMAYNTDGDGW